MTEVETKLRRGLDAFAAGDGRSRITASGRLHQAARTPRGAAPTLPKLALAIVVGTGVTAGAAPPLVSCPDPWNRCCVSSARGFEANQGVSAWPG